LFSGRDKGLQAVLEKAGQIVRQPGRTHTRTGTNDITHNPAMVSYAPVTNILTKLLTKQKVHAKIKKRLNPTQDMAV